MEGTVYLIHKLDNLWIFVTYEKVGKDLIPKRFPFIQSNKHIKDGELIIGELINIGGIEHIKQKFNS